MLFSTKQRQALCNKVSVVSLCRVPSKIEYDDNHGNGHDGDNHDDDADDIDGDDSDDHKDDNDGNNGDDKERCQWQICTKNVS